MKQFRFVFIAVIILLTLFSCEKDKIIESNEDSISLSYSNISTRTANKQWERINFHELENDIHFQEILDVLGLNLYEEASSIDKILIDTSSISKCSDFENGYYSFTFPVHSAEFSNTSTIKNLLLEKRNNSYNARIIEYQISHEDLYAIATNNITSEINIPMEVYPIDPNTIQLRDCYWVTVEYTIPCTCAGHLIPSQCVCANPPIVTYHAYLACDDDSTGGGDGETGGVNIYPLGETGGGNSGGGGGPGNPPGNDDGGNAGTELLIPLYEWYQIKLTQLIDNYDLDLTVEELEEIVPIDCMGGGNPLIGEFEECAFLYILENRFNTPFENSYSLEGYIMGLDENGILRIYFNEENIPDPSSLSEQELVDYVLEIINCVQLYFCETNQYDPIDWTDYFVNTNGGSYVVNWIDNAMFENCPVTLILDFTWGGNIMNTSYSHYGQTSDSPPINNLKWNGVNTDAALLQIATKSINGCRDKLYYYFNPNCE